MIARPDELPFRGGVGRTAVGPGALAADEGVGDPRPAAAAGVGAEEVAGVQRGRRKAQRGRANMKG